jgi:hypothetical protein
MKYLLIPLAIFLFSLNFVSYNINESSKGSFVKSNYNASLVRLNSMSALEAYTDSMATVKNIPQGSLQYAIMAESIVSQRFYHKYATQDLKEDFLASVAQKITGLSLSSKISVNDILTRPYGYCCQQNSVLMELLLLKKLNYRVVCLPRHFAIESFINGQWYYFDADIEHHMLPQQRVHENLLSHPDSFALAYQKTVKNMTALIGNTANYQLGNINEPAGKNAKLFQTVTKFLSRTLFLVPLIVFIFITAKQGSKKAVAVKAYRYVTYPFGIGHLWANLWHTKTA